MSKPFRIFLGVIIVGVILYLADLATRDCRIAPYVYDDCMWVSVRSHLGLPANRFLRMGILECVGIVLALALYLTFRFFFLIGKLKQAPPDSTHLSPPPGI